ncbi:hypothetical protein EV694_0813 [Volucribacter psittacicida]|uniref:Uncharacterized protein n=2 Tax=Volucribacter psittacicida TaxID=203482 RepID=A0A4R1FXB6_9PAST|nr:hypothetical protein EV694_0813 [Volucribacter psittacicida]
MALKLNEDILEGIMSEQSQTPSQGWFKHLLAKYDHFLKTSGLDKKGGCGCMPPARYDPPLYSKEERMALKRRENNK